MTRSLSPWAMPNHSGHKRRHYHVETADDEIAGPTPPFHLPQMQAPARIDQLLTSEVLVRDGVSPFVEHFEGADMAARQGLLAVDRGP